MRTLIIPICISALAESSPCGGTVWRIVTDCAGAKKLETALSPTSTMYTCHSDVAANSSSTRPARSRSLAISVCFRGQRSTNTPEMGPSSASGSM